MTLNEDQLRNAQIIMEVGRQVGASQRDVQIALMTAMQESNLRSGFTESRSDRDSAGLFQQRRAWAPGGSESFRLNPYNSARMFFLGGRQGQRGLLDVRNRGSMSLSQAAQTVQVSAFPTAYAKWERQAAQLVGAPSQGAPRKAGTSGWLRPVAGGRVSQNFGDAPPPGITYARGRKNGMSFMAPTGTAVHAAADGTVVQVTSGGAYGTRIEMAHEGKTWSLYAHLSGTSVQVGQTVRQGQVIGQVGETGQAIGSHLHFEVRTGTNQYGSAVDPRSFLNNNTTPEAYIEDTFTELETVVPGQASDFMAQQQGAMASSTGANLRPYVYRSPYLDEAIDSSMWLQSPHLDADPTERFKLSSTIDENEDMESIDPMGTLEMEA